MVTVTLRVFLEVQLVVNFSWPEHKCAGVCNFFCKRRILWTGSLSSPTATSTFLILVAFYLNYLCSYSGAPLCGHFTLHVLCCQELIGGVHTDSRSVLGTAVVPLPAHIQIRPTGPVYPWHRHVLQITLLALSRKVSTRLPTTKPYG